MDANDDQRRELLQSLAAHCSLPADRFVLLDSLTEADFPQLCDGIVFLYSPWSRQAVVALKAISKLLAESPFAELPLRLVDSGNAGLRLTSFGKVRFGGYGETFWVRGGQVRTIGSNYSESDLDELRAITAKVYHGSSH